jgi:hypothetical protein
VDDRSEILHSVSRYVWSGLYDPEEVTIILAESWGLLGQSGEAWLRVEVEKEFVKKRTEEETWPATTDCDRLDRVFAALEAQGIMVEQDAGLTKSDGLEIVTEAYEDAQADGEGAGIVGYCFYHGQDLDRVMEGGDLCLAFGDFLGDDERGAEIGRCIQRALQGEGVTVEWSGSIGQRLLVRGIRWQRRGR